MLEPESEADLARMVRDATGPLEVRGGGTRAPLAGGDLTTRRMSGIVLYEPGALTMVARAGTPMVEIEDALTREGQRLAFEPWDSRRVLGRDGTPTLGGCVATNASGPRRMVAGAARDSVIGVRFVDGDGAVIKNGGRVMKNVTGIDLTKLMCGSRGRLGILTEIGLKLLPGVAATATLRAHGLDPAGAVAAMSAALGTPFEVTGAVHEPQLGTMLRIEGSETSVAYRAERLRHALAAYGEWQLEGDVSWTDLRDATGFAAPSDDLWRISVRPSHAAQLVAGLPGRWMMDWGGGLIWAEAPAGTDLRALMGLPGHATLIRADPETHAALGTIHPGSDAVERLTRDIAARFDPRGIFAGAVPA
ncbi:FAD-binding protein [Palleronia abyssalis]|uniref:Putative FAD-linked oxidoreductase n=1 Tax=Palleronia abyssalis TaxID=1501240 RepID=A0A2R8C024_9RHOB|nr:FAD-binding protein [Palleronia abyssalis]SPJ25761.1 putative FAD-linked oxidoreductase [Palleronia abyssalis]